MDITWNKSHTKNKLSRNNLAHSFKKKFTYKLFTCNTHTHTHTHIYIYIYILIGIMVRVFIIGPKDRRSTPGRAIPKTQKMGFDSSLLNTQHNKVRIKVKRRNPGKRVVPFSTFRSSSNGKMFLGVAIDNSQPTDYIYIYIHMCVYVCVCVCVCVCVKRNKH